MIQGTTKKGAALSMISRKRGASIDEIAGKLSITKAAAYALLSDLRRDGVEVGTFVRGTTVAGRPKTRFVNETKH